MSSIINMSTDVKKLLIKNAIEKVIHQNQPYSKREIRNLIDIGIEFSKGRFQKRFLTTVQTMLENENSAYFDLVEDTLNHVNHKYLTTFGLNIGYNGCTKGAKIIRENEKGGYNIPWILMLEINENTYDYNSYHSIIQQANELGIYTFALFVQGNLKKIIPLLIGHPESAFTLLLHTNQITPGFIYDIKGIYNVMISLFGNEDLDSICETLREEKMMYSIYIRYTPEEPEQWLQKETLQRLLKHQPLFLFYFPTHMSDDKRLYQTLLDIRQNQTYPVLLMEMRYDSMMIDQVISQDSVFVAFNQYGHLHDGTTLYKDDESNPFKTPLKSIFQHYFKKTDQPR